MVKIFPKKNLTVTEIALQNSGSRVSDVPISTVEDGKRKILIKHERSNKDMRSNIQKKSKNNVENAEKVEPVINLPENGIGRIRKKLGLIVLFAKRCKKGK